MTSVEFCSWLLGVFDFQAMSGRKQLRLSPEQWELVRSRLLTVEELITSTALSGCDPNFKMLPDPSLNRDALEVG